MNKRYYLDSCIWKDYFENRSDRLRPLGDWALALIKKIISEGDLFVISNKVIEELRKDYSLEDLKSMFEIIPKTLIVEVLTNERLIKEALNIKNKFGIHFGDALHISLAKENKAILVSRDNHFYEIQTEIEVKKPEDLI